MARKTIPFHLTLTEDARERLDRLAHEQHCSRCALIARALVHLDIATHGRAVRP